MNNYVRLTPEDFKEEFDLKKWIDEHSCIEEKGVITEKTSPGVISCLECNKSLIFIKLEKGEKKIVTCPYCGSKYKLWRQKGKDILRISNLKYK